MKKLIKIILSVSILFTCFGVNVFAAANVKTIYVKSEDVQNDDGDGTHTEITAISYTSFDDSIPGYLISGGSYSLTEDEKDAFILIDGCDVDGTDNPAGDFRIINNGSYTNGRDKNMGFYEFEITDSNLGDSNLINEIKTNNSYYIYCPQDGDVLDNEIWADQLNIAKDVTITLSKNAMIHIFDSLHVYGTLNASEGSRICFQPPEVEEPEEPSLAKVYGNINLYDDFDCKNVITEMFEYTEFCYTNVGSEEPNLNWIRDTYGPTGHNPEEECMVEVCLERFGYANAILELYIGDSNEPIMPIVTTFDGSQSKFIVPKDCIETDTTITLKILENSDSNFHINSFECEQDQGSNVTMNGNVISFSSDYLKSLTDGFMFIKVEIQEDHFYHLAYNEGAGSVYIKEGDSLVKYGDDSGFYVENSNDEETLYILENSGYEFDSVNVEKAEDGETDEATVTNDGTETISDKTYKKVKVKFINDDRYFYHMDINFKNYSEVKINSAYGTIKSIDFDGEEDQLNDFTAGQYNKVYYDDENKEFRFIIEPDSEHFVEDVKIGSTVLSSFPWSDGQGNDYDAYRIDVSKTNQFDVEVSFTSVYDEFAVDLAKYKLAFYADSKDSIKDYAAKCIFDEFCVHGNNNDHAKYYGLFNSADDIKSKITLSDSTSTEGSIACDGNLLPYYTYTINGVSGFTGKIYTLSSASEFILRDGTTYKKVTVASGANITTGVTVNRTNDYEVFGNGALDQGQSLLTDGQDTSFVEVRQIAPIKALSGTFSIGTSLIVYTNNFRGIYIKSDKIASPWDFANYPLYPLNNGATVNIFYANDSVEISAPEQSTNSTITDINFSNGTKEMNGSKIEENSGKYKVTFGSVFYDEVAINVTFTGGLTKRLTIKRVGIKILDNKIQNDKYKVFHGTDHSTEYDRKVDGSTCMISASFYYVDTNRVTLFARITNADGSITTKEIATPLNSLIGTASQGTHKSYDDFAIWEGLEKDKPRKVEVIAYVSGSGDTFGGVKLGSGAGVAWTR